MYINNENMLRFTAPGLDVPLKDFGVRVNDDDYRVGDDFILRFGLVDDFSVENKRLSINDGDFVAVYDKKMLWRANLYIDEGEENDWNNKHPWIEGNEWNFYHDGKTAFNMITDLQVADKYTITYNDKETAISYPGGQNIAIAPYIAYRSNKENSTAVAYSWPYWGNKSHGNSNIDMDSPFDFNKKLIITKGRTGSNSTLPSDNLYYKYSNNYSKNDPADPLDRHYVPGLGLYDYDMSNTSLPPDAYFLVTGASRDTVQTAYLASVKKVYTGQYPHQFAQLRDHEDDFEGLTITFKKWVPATPSPTPAPSPTATPFVVNGHVVQTPSPVPSPSPTPTPTPSPVISPTPHPRDFVAKGTWINFDSDNDGKYDDEYLPPGDSSHPDVYKTGYKLYNNIFSAGTDCIGFAQRAAGYSNNKYHWGDLHPMLAEGGFDGTGSSRRAYPFDRSAEQYSYKITGWDEKDGEVLKDLRYIVPGDIFFYTTYGKMAPGTGEHIAIVQGIKYTENSRNTSISEIYLIESTFGGSESYVITQNTISYYYVKNSVDARKKRKWFVVRLKNKEKKNEE